MHFTTLTQAQVSKETHKGTTGRFKRWEWGKQIKEGNPAFAWGRFITPLYGIKVVGFLAGMTYSVRPPADCLHCLLGPLPLPVVRNSLSQSSLA